jgi:2-aminoethylphosphonate-pyruvate transaminase
VFYALEEALQELFNEGGQPDRLARYRELQAIVRAGLVALGIEPLLEEGEISAVLAAYFLPKGITYARLHDHLKGEGFVIYAGQGHMARTFFRISTMGAVLDEDVERLVAAVASLLNR